MELENRVASGRCFPATFGRACRYDYQEGRSRTRRRLSRENAAEVAIRVDESADQRTYIIGPCKNAAAYRTILLADAEGREALWMLKRFLKGPQTQTSFLFHSK